MTEKLDLSEKGKDPDGQPISLNRRLFIQLLAYGNVTDTSVLCDALENSEVQGALYEDINDPYGVALVTFSDTPETFVTTVRKFIQDGPFAQLTPKPEYTMLGRTYTIGYESDLEHVLLSRPAQRICNPENRWGVWYPLRRSGTFEQLPAAEQRVMLMEHGGIGRAFGESGYATDIRLACQGLDKNDNDFVTALLGKELHPLSAVVQRMRKTKQTALHLEQLGPFFIGQVAWQSRYPREEKD